MADSQLQPSAERSWLSRMLSHPVFGIVGVLIGIVSVILTVYFYMQSTRNRDLVYYVNPAKAVVVKNGESSNLQVYMGGQLLQNDVTATQVAIWNQGKEPIQSSDMLAPLTIQTNPSVPILEATIRKKSREVIHLSLDQDHLKDGVVTVSWNILEQGDGGVLQLIYAGGTNIDITASGIVVGQGKVRQLLYHGKILSPSAQMNSAQKDKYAYWLELIFAIATFGFGIYAFFYIRREVSRETYPSNLHISKLSFIIMIAVFFVAILDISMTIHSLLGMQTPNPPFGF